MFLSHILVMSEIQSQSQLTDRSQTQSVRQSFQSEAHHDGVEMLGSLQTEVIEAVTSNGSECQALVLGRWT